MNPELENAQLIALWKAVASISDSHQCELFLKDLCTSAELQAMGQRLHVAELLSRNVVFIDIAKLTGASTATITRVNRALRRGEGGYSLVLGK